MLRTLAVATALLCPSIDPVLAQDVSVIDEGSCLALVVARSVPGYVRSDKLIELDAYLQGAAVSRPLAQVYEAYAITCLGNPGLSVVNAMRRAIADIDGD